MPCLCCEGERWVCEEHSISLGRTSRLHLRRRRDALPDLQCVEFGRSAGHANGFEPDSQ
jgi:hypothetical protein